MARYSGAAWKPLGTQTEPKIVHADIVCLHTMVGYLKSTDAYFRDEGYDGVESHFGVGGIWGPDAAAGLDGVVWQWQDTTHQADANGPDGNGYTISIETADNAPQDADDLKPWTERQVDAIVELVTWVCRTHDIPAQLVPDTKPGRRGIAYHAQGCTPNIVPGGDAWSTKAGKVCPGNARISQIKSTIVPRVQAALAGKPQEEDDDMPKLTDQVTVSGSAYDFVKARGAKPSPDDPAKKTGKLPYEWFVIWGYIELVQNNEAIATANAHLSQLVGNTTPPASGAGG
jgi:hypothetical protein